MVHQTSLMYGEGVVPTFVRLAAHPLRWRLLTGLADGDYRVRELVALVGEPQNLVSYHLRLLRDGGLVAATRSSFDGRDSYYHLDLERCAAALAGAGAALHPALATRATPERRRGPRARVLFVCTGNSARSPIAEALLRERAGGRVEVASAGTRPGPSMHPDAVRVLREEFGIDLRARRPRHVDAVAGRRFDYVVSLCDKAREACPEFRDHPRRVHWSIPDPAGGYAAFQHIAAGIDARVKHFLPALDTRS
jgi:ArsR family transcriptional regulator, arsenate/arsenite/antimonite-responsive transcriptional repressor / arsenate reductase (thioredoxin)